MGRSNDFKFWEETLPEGDFEGQPHRVKEQIGADSPPLWTRALVSLGQEKTSSLVPPKRPHSCRSPPYRLRAIVDGRKELMEMITNMPDSCHELSLKDIVKDVQENETVEKKVKHKRENRHPQRYKNTQICRSGSMESEVFLLKMFLPVSLSSKKKVKARRHSTNLSGESSAGSEKPANKEWWKMIFLDMKDNHQNMSIKRSMSDISSNRTSENKCESRVQRGCGCLF